MTLLWNKRKLLTGTLSGCRVKFFSAVTPRQTSKRRNNHQILGLRVISNGPCLVGKQEGLYHVQHEQKVQEICQDFIRDIPKGNGAVSLESLSPGLVVLRLSNETRRNALSPSMMVQLYKLLSSLHSKENHDPLYGLILSGSNGTFCSGFDLSAASSHFQTPKMGSKMSQLMHANYSLFRSLPLLTVSAIEGYALGGGAELTTWTDFRILSKSGKIQFVQAKMGVTPGWGGGDGLVRIVGSVKALHLFSGSIPITQENGLSLGYIDSLAPENFAESAAKDFLDGFLENSHGSVATLKGLKNVILNAQEWHEKRLSRERDIFTSLWGAKDNLTALARVQKGKKAKK